MPELNAVVSQRVEISPHTIILRVIPDGWELPEFTPGQFAVMGLPGSAPRITLSDPEEEPPDPERLIRRAYSIASSSVEREYVEFYITLIRSGALTPRIFALNVGDRVWLSQKFQGLFTLKELPGEVTNIVMAATGTGLAPYMSMIRTELIRDAGRKFAVIHGARHSWDLGYRSELVTMQRLCANFSYIPVISRPAEEPVPWGGATEYVQDLWKAGPFEAGAGFKPDPSNTHVFLCGNPAMIEDMVRLLAEEGFREQTKKTPGEVHLERYW